MRFEQRELGDAWSEHAAQWIAWARAPGHDSYWSFHRDAFLELVPSPGRATLDIGCGEGRLSRDLRALGHDVTGVDLSPAMVEAARAAEPAIPVHEADAKQLPFGDASFDCVVAFMSLQDVDDLESSVREASRVLAPGGRLVLAVVHPLNSAGVFQGDEADAPLVVDGSYLARSYYADTVERDGLAMTFVSAHRPIQAYVDALADAGLLVERLREVGLPEAAVMGERQRRWQRIPLFLHVRASRR
jgi:SAM-dependent methyltransferase